MSAFINYKKPDNMSIQTAHKTLRKMAKTLCAKKPGLKDALGELEIFDQLLASLPDKYSAVQDTIDSQGINHKDIESALEQLEIKED